ncbi:MAG TPA: hypothetical protein VFT80_09925 [Actinomycetota bacterium]|nr:hypothetical protein [Actinomycetota bacterium]
MGAGARVVAHGPPVATTHTTAAKSTTSTSAAAIRFVGSPPQRALRIYRRSSRNGYLVGLTLCRVGGVSDALAGYASRIRRPPERSRRRESVGVEREEPTAELQTEDLDTSESHDQDAVADTSATLPPPPPGTPDAETDDETRTTDRERTSLLADERASSFRHRWDEIQVRFVDEPRSAVEDADRLVTEVIEQLQASFTSERGRLEGQWQQGGEVSTEDLRVALQRYRSFFDRLLAA